MFLLFFSFIPIILKYYRYISWNHFSYALFGVYHLCHPHLKWMGLLLQALTCKKQNADFLRLFRITVCSVPFNKLEWSFFQLKIKRLECFSVSIRCRRFPVEKMVFGVIKKLELHYETKRFHCWAIF